MKKVINSIIRRLKTPKIVQRLGLILVYVGALLLISSYIFGKTNINALLLAYLLLIAAGIIIYVLALKLESRY